MPQSKTSEQLRNGRERSLRVSLDMYECIRDPNSTYYEEPICQSKIIIVIMPKLSLFKIIELGNSTWHLQAFYYTITDIEYGM